MTTRTLNFLGRAIGEPNSVLVSCQVNGQVLYEGAATNTYSDQDMVLWSVQIPMSWQGPIPVEIHCRSGHLIQTQVTANYCGNRVTFDLTDGWKTSYPQVNQSELLDDIMQYSNDWSWIENKYGSAAPGYGDIVTTVVTASGSNFEDAAGENTVESDGRDAVTIDGVPQHMDLTLRDRGQRLLGDWAWEIYSNQTLTYTLNLRPALDVD